MHSLRKWKESETFDLAGQNQNSISTTMEAAFSTPLPIQHMIRITFITGAGKLGRQKYDENAARVLTSTLRSLGYEEDRAASCVVECAGSFKSQHDTGKNLKTIVVFPNISLLNKTNENDLNTSAMGHMNLGTDNSSSKLPNGSPKHMCAISTMPTFTKMLNAKCPSWSQKKGCLAAIQSVMEVVQSMEDQLGKGQPLSETDQDLFDSISVDALNQKEIFVKKEMQQQVDDGKLTSSEKEMLLGQVKEKILKVEEELKAAVKHKKPKKEAKLNTMLDKLKTRNEKLDTIVAQPPHPLRLQSEIVKLRIEMVPLQKLVDSAKGRLLSMKETKTLARRDEILQEIEELEVYMIKFSIFSK